MSLAFRPIDCYVKLQQSTAVVIHAGPLVPLLCECKQRNSTVYLVICAAVKAEIITAVRSLHGPVPHYSKLLCAVLACATACDATQVSKAQFPSIYKSEFSSKFRPRWACGAPRSGFWWDPSNATWPPNSKRFALWWWIFSRNADTPTVRQWRFIEGSLHVCI